MKRLSCLILAAIMVLPAAAADLKTLRVSAESLDELVKQKASKRVVVSQGRAFEQKAAPLNLNQAAPILSAMLKIPEQDLIPLLRNDREKLSRIAYARVLEAQTGRPWKEYLRSSDRQLLAALQREKIPLDAVESVLRNVYHELVTLSLDSLMQVDSRS